MSGTPTPSSSKARSRRMNSMVLAAKASSWLEMPARASTMRSAMDWESCLVPRATASSPR